MTCLVLLALRVLCVLQSVLSTITICPLPPLAFPEPPVNSTLVRHKYASTHTVPILSTWQQDDRWGDRLGAMLSAMPEMAIQMSRYAVAHMDIKLLFLNKVGAVDAGRLTQNRLIPLFHNLCESASTLLRTGGQLACPPLNLASTDRCLLML